MADRRDKIEVGSSSFRREIKLTPAIGDWTTLKVVRAPQKKVKTGLYGFDRLSQEELRTAHIIHYNFGQALISSLKRDLSTGGDLFSVAVEQTTYSDFLKRVYQPTVYSKISVPGLPEDVVVCVDMPLANTIINHALGGRDLSPITRKLTDIEEGVLTKVLSGELEGYTAAFDKIFEPPKYSIASSPEIMVEGTISPSATFVFFSIEISLGDNPPGVVWMGYTSSSLKTLIERVEKRRGQRAVNFSRLPQSMLEGINISLIADLGGTGVLTKELHRLEEGDVVSLNTALGDFIPVFLGGQVKVLGRPGTKNGRLASRVFVTKPTMSPRETPSAIHEEDANLTLEKEGQGEYPMEETAAEEGMEEGFPELKEEL